MDMTKIKHLLSLKSTWVAIIAQLMMFVNYMDCISDKEMVQNILTGILELVTILGVVNIYNTEPVKEDEED